MVVWAICIYTTDDSLGIGMVYDVYEETSSAYLVKNSNGQKELINKRWFVPDTDPVFTQMLNYASFMGELELDAYFNVES